jgi:ATP-dependent RNA helicase RhlE
MTAFMTHIATRFSDLNLSRHIASALDKIGYETPTPIQQQAIPEILRGRDIQGIAQTGTGKTAAFSLPILSHIADDPLPAPKRSTRVLALSPTRELASQIGESMKNYARHIDGFRSTVIFGGVPISKQVRKLVPGNDVIVATPGRLLDLLGQKIIHLNAVEYLILDEADQMMDMGFIHTLRKIIPLLPEKRQTLFFSATMPKSISNLAAQFLTNPVKISITPESTTAERVEQSIIYATKTEKQNLLSIKLLDSAIDRALVFTRTKHGADRVVKRLATIGLDARAIHGNKSQSQRTRALTAFKDGEVKFLIATDVAARGIDIRGVSHVFNFEIPNVPEQYVHRIGRTGRAGEAGIAISFVAPDEKAYLKDIQKILKQTIAVDPLPDDFAEQSKALKKRPALEKPPAAERPPARRQKDRKSRPSRHRKGSSNTAEHNNGAEVIDEPRSRPRKNTDPKNPSRAERKRQKAGQPRKPREIRPERSDTGADKSVRRKSGTENAQGSGASASGDRRERRQSSDDFRPKSKDFKPKGKGGKRSYKSNDDRPSSSGRPQNKSSSFKRKPRANNDERSKPAHAKPTQARTQPSPASDGRSSSGQSSARHSSDRHSSGAKGRARQNEGGGNSGGGWASPKRKNTGRKTGPKRGGKTGGNFGRNSGSRPRNAP